MPTISANTTQTITLAASTLMRGIGAAVLSWGTPLQTVTHTAGDEWHFGPFTAAQAVSIHAQSLLTYSTQAVSDDDPVDKLGLKFDGGLTAAQVQAVQDLVSQGAGYEPTIGSVVTQRVTVNEGSDADHAEILLTFNAGPAGDIAIASERFAAADTRADVIKTLVTGATADGALLAFALPDGLTSLFVARRGESSYTLAAGATVTAAESVAALWAGALNLRYCTVNVGGPYKSGGSNNRYRDLVITGYAGV